MCEYMGVISQNALSLITAPPSGGNAERKKIITFCVTYIPRLVSFGVCSGSEKCDNH